MPNPVPPIHRAFTPLGPVALPGGRICLCDPLRPSQGLTLPLGQPALAHVMHHDQRVEALAVTCAPGAERTLRVAPEPPLELNVNLSCAVIGDADLTTQIDLTEPPQDLRRHQGPGGVTLQYGVDFRHYAAPIPTQDGLTMNELLARHGWITVPNPTRHLPLDLNRLMNHKYNALNQGRTTAQDESGLWMVMFGEDGPYPVYRLITPGGVTGGYLLLRGAFGVQDGWTAHFTPESTPDDLTVQRAPRTLTVSTGTQTITAAEHHPQVLISSASERWVTVLRWDTPLIAAQPDPHLTPTVLSAGSFVQVGPLHFADIHAPVQVTALRDPGGPCGFRITWPAGHARA